jgi:hypothetical protein
LFIILYLQLGNIIVDDANVPRSLSSSYINTTANNEIPSTSSTHDITPLLNDTSTTNTASSLMRPIRVIKYTQPQQSVKSVHISDK